MVARDGNRTADDGPFQNAAGVYSTGLRPVPHAQPEGPSRKKKLSGGQGRNRTADASLFRAALYQLSYLAMLTLKVGWICGQSRKNRCVQDCFDYSQARGLASNALGFASRDRFGLLLAVQFSAAEFTAAAGIFITALFVGSFRDHRRHGNMTAMPVHGDKSQIS